MMADITNAQAVRWMNERGRTTADKCRELYEVIEDYLADYAAQNVASSISSAAIGDIFLDGSAIDGRAPVTKTQLANLNACLTQIKTAFDTTLVPGVGSVALTTINAVQVNGARR
jgi:hypothetical protein